MPHWHCSTSSGNCIVLFLNFAVAFSNLSKHLLVKNQDAYWYDIWKKRFAANQLVHKTVFVHQRAIPWDWTNLKLIVFIIGHQCMLLSMGNFTGIKFQTSLFVSFMIKSIRLTLSSHIASTLICCQGIKIILGQQFFGSEASQVNLNCTHRKLFGLCVFYEKIEFTRLTQHTLVKWNKS